MTTGIGLNEILLFMLIGVIVSLDVAGLTAVKSRTYLGSTWSAVRWAQRNAFWHAALLFGYGVTTIGVLDWVVIDGLDWLIAHLPDMAMMEPLVDVLKEIRMHFSVAFALATIFVVWTIYKRKIVENPLATDEAGSPGQPEPDWQRRSIRWILSSLRFSYGFIARQMEAVAVAIDMLALAFLFKSLEVFQASPLRVLEVSAVIYVTVFVTILLVSRLLRKSFQGIVLGPGNERHRARALNRVLLIIRLTEPLLIFYFVCELLCFVIWGRMSSNSLFFISSAVLTFALIRSVGLQTVVDTTAAMAISLVGKVDDERK